jgi:hypothetical protein
LPLQPQRLAPLGYPILVGVFGQQLAAVEAERLLEGRGARALDGLGGPGERGPERRDVHLSTFRSAITVSS